MQTRTSCHGNTGAGQCVRTQPLREMYTLVAHDASGYNKKIAGDHTDVVGGDDTSPRSGTDSALLPPAERQEDPLHADAGNADPAPEDVPACEPEPEELHMKELAPAPAPVCIPSRDLFQPRSDAADIEGASGDVGHTVGRTASLSRPLQQRQSMGGLRPD